MRVRRQPLSRAAGRGHRPGPGAAARACSATLPAVFTPPWNRCAPWTGEVLRELGFDVLVPRPSPPGTLRRRRPAELPVTVDWFAKRKGVPVDRAGRGRAARRMRRAATGPVGRDAAPRGDVRRRTSPTSARCSPWSPATAAASVGHLDAAGAVSRSRDRVCARRQRRKHVRRRVPGGEVAGVEDPPAVPDDHRRVVGRVVGVHDHQVGRGQLLGGQVAHRRPPPRCRGAPGRRRAGRASARSRRGSPAG